MNDPKEFEERLIEYLDNDETLTDAERREIYQSEMEQRNLEESRE